MSTRPSCLSPAEIEAVLKRAGINPTAQRIAICRFVLCEADHPTAEVVKVWVDENFPKMSLATVYNTLRILVEAGLLRELRLPHTESVLYDNNLTDHVHFLDEPSGVLYDVPREQVAVSATLDPAFEVAHTEVLFRGRRR